MRGAAICERHVGRGGVPVDSARGGQRASARWTWQAAWQAVRQVSVAAVSMVRRCVALLRRSGMTVSGASVSTSAVCWECVHDLVCNLSISLA